MLTRLNLLIYVDQALDGFEFAPKIRKKCVKSLYKMCAGRTLLPKSLHFEIPEDSAGVVVYRGGFADVLRREHRGQEVAVKALRVYGDNRLQETTNVSRLWTSNPFYALGNEHDLVEVLQGGYYLEISSASECVTAAGGGNDQESIRYGIRVDEKWEHQ